MRGEAPDAHISHGMKMYIGGISSFATEDSPGTSPRP